MSVKIQIRKTESALKKMTDAFIARGIAEAMQGVTLRATLNTDGGADIDPGQDFPVYWLPHGTFFIFVSRAEAIAWAKRISPHKVNKVKRAKKV